MSNTAAAALTVGETEAAQLAGVSLATWRRMRKAGKVIAPFRLGHMYKWSREALLQWIRELQDNATVIAPVHQPKPEPKKDK